jgi:hypothetical protein
MWCAGSRRSSAAQHGEAGERRSVVNDFKVGAHEAGAWRPWRRELRLRPSAAGQQDSERASAIGAKFTDARDISETSSEIAAAKAELQDGLVA